MNTIAKTITALLLLCTALFANSVRNGDFEKGFYDWVNWGTAEIDETGGYRNSPCLMVTSSSGGWVGANQDIVIPKNAVRVDIEGRVKTENVQRGQMSWETAQLTFEYLDENDNHIDPYPDKVASVTGTTEWKTYFERFWIGAEREPAKLRLVCALGNATGTVWFDDLSVVFRDRDYKEIKRVKL